MPDTGSAAPPRPRSVTVAGFVALAACGVVATYLAVTLVTLGIGGASGDTPASGRFTEVAAVFLVWALGGAALAWRTLQGASWARWALLVSALLSGSVALTASAFVAPALLPVAASLTTFCLLLGAPARAWFRAVRG